MQRVFLAGYYRTPLVNREISRRDQCQAILNCVGRTLGELRLGMTDKVDMFYLLSSERFRPQSFGLDRSVPMTVVSQKRPRAYGLRFIHDGIERIRSGKADLLFYLGASRERQFKFRYDYQKEAAEEAAKKTIKANHASHALKRLIFVNIGDDHAVLQDELLGAARSKQRVFAAASFVLISEKMTKELDAKPLAELYKVGFDEHSSMPGALTRSLSPVTPKLSVGALRAIEVEESWHGMDGLRKDLKIPDEYVNKLGDELATGDPGQRVSDFIRIGRLLEVLKAKKNDYGAVVVHGDEGAQDDILYAAALTLRRIHFWNEDVKAAL